MTRFRANASTTEKPRGDGSKMKGSSDAKAAGQKRVPTPTALVTATEKPVVTRKKDEVKGAEDIGKEKVKGKGKDVSMVAKGKEKKVGDSERRGVPNKVKEGVKPERSGVLVAETPREKKVGPGKAEAKGKESVVKAPLEGKAKLSMAMLEGKAKERGETAKVPPTAATPKEVGKAKLGTNLVTKPQKVQASAPAPAPAAKKAPAAVLSKELKPKPTKPEVLRVGVKRPRQDIEEDEPEQGAEDEESVHLHGFSTDEDDSSDEEGIFADAIDASALPSAAKDDAAVRKRLDKAKRMPVSQKHLLVLFSHLMRVID
jgi:nucleolar protein 15